MNLDGIIKFSMDWIADAQSPTISTSYPDLNVAVAPTITEVAVRDKGAEAVKSAQSGTDICLRSFFVSAAWMLGFIVF